MADPRKQATRRKSRVRGTIRKVTSGRVRLSVFRSSKHIYAQVIDDLKGETLVSASSIEKDMRGGLKTGADIEAAKAMLANPDIGVTQIAHRLGVSPATLYRYIPAARTANLSTV